MDALQVVQRTYISVRRPRKIKGGVVRGVLEVERWVAKKSCWGVKRNHPRLFRVLPFDHRRMGGIRVHVVRPHCFALPRRQTFVGLTSPPESPQKTPEISIHAMEQTTVLYAFVSFLVLVISSVSFEVRIWTFRDESTFILVLRAVSFAASRQRREVSSLALAPSGCQWFSDLGLSTAISIACCLLTLKLYAALVFWSPQSIVTYSSEKKYRCRRSPNKPIPLPYIDDSATVDLSVIVPTYNETKRLPKMLEPTIKHILSIPKRKAEILIVDDGSADNTPALALEYAKKNPEVEIRVITREKNSGKGGAVRHGMLHSRGKRLLMVDADGASRFEDLELLWAALDRVGGKSPDHAAIAIGSRAHLVKTEAVVKVPPLKLGK